MLSEYVIGSIRQVGKNPKNLRYMSAVSFSEEIDSAILKKDKEILELLSIILSMKFNLEEKCFETLFPIKDGSRQFELEDISKEDTDILIDCLDYVEDNFYKARLAHILYVKDRDYNYGKLAFETYIEYFEEVFDLDNWVECFESIKLSNAIAQVLGPKEYRKVHEFSINKIKEIHLDDQRYLTIQLIGLIVDKAKGEDLSLLVDISKKMLERYIQEQKYNEIGHIFDTIEKVLKKAKLQYELRSMQIKLAQFYEEQSEIYNSVKGNAYFGKIFLEKSLKLYKQAEMKSDMLRIRKKIEPLQLQNRENMQHTSFKVEAKDVYNNIKEMFAKLTFEEKIVYFSYFIPIYKKAEIIQMVEDEQKSSFFGSFFHGHLMDEAGRTVEVIPPLSFGAMESDEMILSKHMALCLKETYACEIFFALDIALEQIQNCLPGEDSSLDFLLSNNLLVPADRERIIEKGIYLGLRGDLYAALHILLPQTENIFRRLAYMCEDTITFYKDDSTEDFKPLSAILKSDALKEYYDSDIIFAFKMLMDMKSGGNLRNLVAHGWLEDSRENEAMSLCFFALLIKLLMFYSKDTSEIKQQINEKLTTTT